MRAYKGFNTKDNAELRCVSSRYVFVGTSAKLLHLKVTMESEVIAGVSQRCFDLRSETDYRFYFL